MKFSKFHKMIQKILRTDLPCSREIIKDGRVMAGDIRIGKTAFMRKMGVASELVYKKKCMQENTIMFHAHIGMNSWNSTAAALVLLDNTAEKNGFIVDRAGICLDRRMGLPKAHRKDIPAETGPMLDSIKDWKQVGQTVPIQPDEIVSEAGIQKADAILISTHNGMALEYAKQLRVALEVQKIRLPVLIGGILNQKVESQSLPVDVTGNLKELGFYPCARLEGRFKKMLASNIKPKGEE